ncbi:response regulator [Marinobacteraceae bacterium S3BR75-40.1]
MSETANPSHEATILLVDDNPENLKVLYETLKDRGYRLLIANDGEKALSLAERDQPEVILLDIMMPGMDGFEVCRRLKTGPGAELSAIIFLSALDDVESKIKGFSLGGVDYISKPFQAQEVIARVVTHVRVIQLERALQARNQQLESDQARILNAINEGIYGLDPSGQIIFANPAAGAINHCQPAELVGRNFFQLHFDCPMSSPGPGFTPASETCDKGIPEHQRGIGFKRPDGSTFMVEYRATPKLEKDVLMGAVVVFEDITAEIQQEAELEEARRLVDVQREQLAHASRLSTMGEMAAGFAHEVNQPLTAIANYARVACRMLEKENQDCPRVKETLQKIDAQAHRASEVIRRIRGFVRKPASGKECIDLGELLTETCRFAEVDAHNNAIEIRLELPETLPEVKADPIQVQQVALNLIRNALEASARCADPEQPVIVSAEVADNGSTVRVAVLDRGCGLPEDAEERLFHPFFTTKSEGMGIGLALCRSLVQSQGGEIGFRRREQGGTEFYFTLPAVDDAQACDEPLSASLGQ